MRMRTVAAPPASYCFLAILCCGCGNYRFERHVVFDGPAATRIERVRQYSLEDQYKVFRYGNDVVEPPLMGLAKPIAERGSTAIPFLLKQLDANPDDTTTRDLLLIFQEMTFSKTYDVKADTALMSTMSTRVSKMRDKSWQDVCLKMLHRIEED